MTYTDDETARGLDPENVPTTPGAAAHSDVPVGTGLDDGGEYALVFPPEGRVAEMARALNDAADGEEHLVQWSDGAFRVPKRIADAADLSDSSAAVDLPAAGGSSSPTVRESGFGNVAPGADGNKAAVVTDPPTPGITPPAAPSGEQNADTRTAELTEHGALSGPPPAAPSDATGGEQTPDTPAKSAATKAAAVKSASSRGKQAADK